jgi:hypothetical protein
MRKMIVIGMLSIISCNKKDSQDLPTPTQEGKNILACIVDGQAHVYSGISNVFNENGVDYRLGTNSIKLISESTEYRDFIEVVLPSFNSLNINTTYYLSSDTGRFYANRFTGNNGRPYQTVNYSGWVRFSRLDSNIASGSFAFTGYRPGDSTVITDGTFDLKNN